MVFSSQSGSTEESSTKKKKSDFTFLGRISIHGYDQETILREFVETSGKNSHSNISFYHYFDPLIT